MFACLILLENLKIIDEKKSESDLVSFDLQGEKSTENN